MAKPRSSKGGEAWLHDGQKDLPCEKLKFGKKLGGGGGGVDTKLIKVVVSPI